MTQTTKPRKWYSTLPPFFYGIAVITISYFSGYREGQLSLLKLSFESHKSLMHLLISFMLGFAMAHFDRWFFNDKKK